MRPLNFLWGVIPTYTRHVRLGVYTPKRCTNRYTVAGIFASKMHHFNAQRSGVSANTPFCLW